MNSYYENLVVETIPLTGWRKELCRRMLTSHQECASVTQMREVDASMLVTLRDGLVDDLKEKYGFRLTYTPLMIKASADALRQHRMMNSALIDNEIRVLDNINIGMAMSLDYGSLMVPVIMNADKKSVVEIAQEANELVRQIKSRRFSLNCLMGGTFTVTNAGMYGTDFVTPIINLPQAAILGVGRIVEKPVVRDKQIVARSMMGLSVTYDHRFITGAIAAEFFRTLEQILANPMDKMKIPP